MSEAPIDPFHPPGPGVWELETAHNSKPTPRFMQGPILEGFGRGFSESTARFGVMLDRLEPRFVNDFTFVQPRPFGAPPGAKGPPPKIIFQLLMRLLPKMRARMRTAQETFTNKTWRLDMKLWDEEVRPASDKRHREIQAIDPSTLDDVALMKHLKACRDQCRDMVRQHHRFTITASLPVGDLIAHVNDWTGKSAGEILSVLRGSSQISLGVASRELEAVAAAIRADASALAVLEERCEPKTILDRLRTRTGVVNDAMTAYLDVVSYRCLGYDVGGKYGLEMPSVLVSAIRAAVAGKSTVDARTTDRIASLRKEVPEAHRVTFDGLLEEARFINRIRDERGHYSDGWAVGLTRRVLLEVGRRLMNRRTIDDAELAVDASYEELDGLMDGATSPTLAELHRRNRWRTSRSVSDMDIPRSLGGEPSGPPPADWLPEGGRRAHRAIGAALDALFTEPAVSRTDVSVRGFPVSPGIYEGTARLVDDVADFDRIQRGDVLVTRSTSPYFNVVLPLLGAIVTDRGGQLCHAAIVSREYGIPGVVGTREATALVKDGARVRVDGTKGEVTVLG